ncbi:MAG: flagellin [Methylibium sp.]|uniref:flagellin N-terminal helical domain-containing protein n=1 Tax=Methylibium sp. TaxID=2067992 RepID=UPI00183DCB39|nr:flagellin [Methylibium sp.]MBA2722103.1 flagellin [Methylibium sp.]MBA3589235.1 flagellin [Methylibium sp.]
MALTINTNVVSLNAQRNLNSSQSSLAVSMQRLSSGLRVNSAKDDAAGLAIAERMNTQVRGLNVAARNANDGISLAQTAEGALGKLGDMLQRMRELAVQSANATNNATDREALNAEVVQLKLEIERVATTTAFNDTKLLDGSFTAKNFQVGANSGETIELAGITDARLVGLGMLTTVAAVDEAAVTGTATFNALADGDLMINGVNIGAVAADTDAATTAAAITAAVNARTAETGVTATATGASIEYTSTEDIVVAVTAGGATATGLTSTTTAAAEVTPATTEVGIANLNISTAEAATFAMDAIDTALTAVNSARGTLGAVQSRFESAISNIQVTAENLSAARGRIMDADFAAETANLSRAQILQQAGTAMVAQANQLPQQVLQLLQG